MYISRTSDLLIKHKGAILLLAALGFVLWYYLPCALVVLYNYIWWVLYSGTVHNASPVPEGKVTDGLPIPKLLHQTWRTTELPEKWKAAQQSCIDAHPGYKYKLWTDEEGEKLIATRYSWFLRTYKSYPYSIQRVDALRYFILYEYGGIYMDLDVVCVKSLDRFRNASFVAPKTYPIGVSNDVMMARPRSAFAHQLIANLKHWKKYLIVKYVEVMITTGPMFVTIQYSVSPYKDEVQVLPADVYGKYSKTADSYLKHLHGSSWHGNDARYIFWLEHYGLKAVTYTALLLMTAGTALLVFIRYTKSHRAFTWPFSTRSPGPSSPTSSEMTTAVAGAGKPARDEQAIGVSTARNASIPTTRKVQV